MRAGQVDASLQSLKSRGPALLVERDDLAVDEDRFAEFGAKRLEPLTIDGNCIVFSLPSRDQMRTRGRRSSAARARARGCRRTSARRPDRPTAAAARSASPHRRTLVGSSRHLAIGVILSVQRSAVRCPRSVVRGSGSASWIRSNPKPPAGQRVVHRFA
jgi:hypothetical protein